MELKEVTPQSEDYMSLDIDDIEEIDFNEDPAVKEIEVKVNQKEKNAARKSIEEILEARALRRELADLFDDDLLLD
ncbi:MAG TPA: hypothetical protein EYH35_02440 [Thiotrichaceae bacterium]|nr:hypothetical protein [Thiotrichaceae bacterium]